MHLIEKKVGETPLEALEAWRVAHLEIGDAPACYAGRLDPMASGQLLILVGDECKEMETYRGLDKEYEVEVLLGVGSDTGDILGLVADSPQTAPPTTEDLITALASQVGTHTLSYPVFSSKTVNGKPLFVYALEGTLDTISIPTHEETIYDIELVDTTSLSTHELKERVTSLLALAPTSDEPSKALGADFRIADVQKSWNAVFASPRTYTVLRIRVFCASGTYMRSLAGRIGETVGTSALALSIHRTKICV